MATGRHFVSARRLLLACWEFYEPHFKRTGYAEQCCRRMLQNLVVSSEGDGCREGDAVGWASVARGQVSQRRQWRESPVGWAVAELFSMRGIQDGSRSAVEGF